MVVLAATLVLATVGLIWFLYQRFGNLIYYGEKLPGPPAYPLIGNGGRFLNKSTAEFLIELGNIIKEYGKCCRIWLGTDLLVLVTDAKIAETILSSPKYLDKSIEYDFVRPWLGDGLLTSTGRKWHSRRKIITPTFHFKIMEQFVETFDQQSTIFVQQLKEKAESGQAFDIYPYVTLCALDVISETAMGTKVDAQLNSDSEYVRAVKDMAHLIQQRVFNVLARSNLTFRFTRFYKMHENALKVLHGYTDSVIQSRKKELASKASKTENAEDDLGIRKKVAFLDMLLETRVDGKPLDDLEVREEVDTFMFEGHDTTTSAISFLLRVLAEHPDVQRKVYDEVRHVIGDDLSTPITLKMLNELNYLDQTIKECLRMYPSVPIFGRKFHENHEINGMIFPKGSNVVFLPYFMGNDPDYFENPEQFRPERFSVETSAEKNNPYRYVPFSAGPRNCIGQKFAVAEIKSLISKTLRHYELLPSGIAKDPTKSTFVAEMILRDEAGMLVKLRKRV
ncbi:cytochrome P450 4d1-like isoform X2 [Uranotaenia lowii]|uniref:cytochrome P450 4d1-like isoform X2 n=1 Tax=Uranotaenia lowii TaxID=190385 RepID=UPI002478AC0C|nr:cytochrome P450 4d1-like isoform X2 [Uranotaenia lowii]